MRAGTLRRVALAAGGAALLGVAAAWAAGLVDPPEPESLGRWLAGSGALGAVLFVALFALLEPFGVPGLVFILPATLAWSGGSAFLLCWAGAVGAGLVGFAFARSIGRPWVEERLPERFRRFDARLGSRGFVTVVAVRLAFFLAPPAHWLLGLSRVRLLPFALGTAVGFAPGIALWVLVGEGLLAWLSSRPPATWLAVAAAVLALVALRRWRRRAARAA